MSTSENAEVRYIAGSVSPIGTDRHPMSMPEPLVPPYVKRIACSIEIPDYTTEGVNEAIAQRYWPCVGTLVEQGANSISLNGLPISSQLGRPRVLELIEETKRRTGVTADSQAEATIAALRHFGAKRIAIAKCWRRIRRICFERLRRMTTYGHPEPSEGSGGGLDSSLCSE